MIRKQNHAPQDVDSSGSGGVLCALFFANTSRGSSLIHMSIRQPGHPEVNAGQFHSSGESASG